MFMITERLFLRPLWPEDAPALVATLGREPIVKNLGTAPWPYRLEDAERKIAEDWAAWPHKVNLGIFLRAPDQGRLVGGIGFGKRPDRRRETELGYWIAEEQWGRGIAVEAGRAVLEHAFLGWRHPRLSAGHYTDNPKSGRVLQKLGFRPTGEISSYASIGRGCDVDCVEYELLADDWLGARTPLAA